MSSEFKNLAELITALRNYELHKTVDPRFSVVNGNLQIKGASEIVAADGGYLVGGEIIAPLQHALSQKATLFAKASKFYSSSDKVNKGLIPFVTESSRVEASFQLRTYWPAELASKTAAKFSLDLVECPLNKIYSVMYCTDELWSDASGFKSAIDNFITSEKEGSLIWGIERAMLYGSSSTTMAGIMGPVAAPGIIQVVAADPLDEATLNAFNDALAPATHKTSEWYVSEENYRDIQAINFTNEGDKYYQDGDLYIYGKKVNVMEQMIAGGDIMLGDASHYAIALKDGPLVSSMVSVHLKLLTDEKTIRWGIRINGGSFGSTYDLDDGSSVGTFVIPDTAGPYESSSSSVSSDSSSVDSHSSGSSASSESSTDSTQSDQSNSTQSLSTHSTSSASTQSASTQSLSSASSQSLSSASSQSLSSASSQSVSTSSSSSN